MWNLTKTFAISFLILAMILLSPSSISLATKYDFEGHWAEQTIKIWVEKGFLTMYEDETFRPDEPISRAEYVSMINKLFNLTAKDNLHFLDVQEDAWFYEAISIAKKAGYIVGKEESYFRPNQPVTREEASAMLGRIIFNNAPANEETNPALKDFDQVADFAKQYVSCLIREELLEGYADSTFRPVQALSRAEAVVLLDRIAVMLGVSRPYYADKVAVLMYHSVRNDYKYDHCINKAVFSNHMSMLRKSGFNVITLDTFLNFLEGKGTLPENAVLITFDDGYEDFYNLAYPILRDKGYSATMFMITSTIGDKSGWNPKLDVAQMQEMIKRNIFFQSHSHNAHYYVQGAHGKEDAFLVTRTFDQDQGLETFDHYYGRIDADLHQSKQVLDELLKQDTKALAVPYGRVNETVKEIANTRGLYYNFTIKPGIVTAASAKMSLPRINAGYSAISDEELKNIILRNGR